MKVSWVSGFLDLAAGSHEEGVRFWEDLTGWERSAVRGARGEFLTLVPPKGDATVRVQRVGGALSAMHVDLHVEDVAVGVREAQAAGGTLVARYPADGYATVRSPGGLAVCIVPDPGSAAPPAQKWDGHGSVADQLSVDVPGDGWERETAFWTGVTGRELRPGRDRAEFSRLVSGPGEGLKILLQRLGETGGPVRAHLDFATTDRKAETARHTARGARVEHEHTGWTVLRAPDGLAYCVTDRVPDL
ncbi:hypothetical protein GCM10022221_71590 [Actinocorallia aurea]